MGLAGRVRKEEREVWTERINKGVKNGGEIWLRVVGLVCLETAFLCTFMVRTSGFQDFLREKSSSLFMLSR